MKGFSYLKNVTTLHLDSDRCVGCGICTEVCPHQLLHMWEGKALIIDRDACMECGACALNCPVKALTVDAGVGCASGMINEWLASLNSNRKGGGGCC